MFTKLSWRFVLCTLERCFSLIISKINKGIFKQKVHLRRYFLYFSDILLHFNIFFPNSVINHRHYSYVTHTYKTFLEHLYTGTINLSSIENLLGEYVKYATYYSFIVCNLRLNYFFVADLLKLADEYLEYNLERDCIKLIKKGITASNIFLIIEAAIGYDKTVTGSIISFYFIVDFFLF